MKLTSKLELLSDNFFEIFGVVWSFFLCCLVLPVAIGLLTAIVQGLNIFFEKVWEFQKNYGYWYYGISIIFGLFLTIYLSKKTKK